MAGHSQFKNIMHRKGAQDAKRGKIFTKIQREIYVAVKTGAPDPDANPRLRAALTSARQNNMPKDNIERTIKKALGGDDAANYEEVRYEGYGPKGVAIIVEALTDNRNRTASEVRAAFTKHGGTMGESGSVSFMFERIGLIQYQGQSVDALFEVAIDAGADNIEETGDMVEVSCAVENFHAVRDALQKKAGDPVEAKIIWRPQTMTALDEESAKALLKMIDVLEDNDDVQNVFSNFEVSDDVMTALATG